MVPRRIRRQRSNTGRKVEKGRVSTVGRATVRPPFSGGSDRRTEAARVSRAAATPDVDLDGVAELGDVGRPDVGEADTGRGQRGVRAARHLADQLIAEEHRVVRARDVPAFVHPEADEHARQRVLPLTEQRRASSELALLERDRPRQSRFERGHRLEQILSVQGIPHLEPQHVAGCEAAGGTSDRLHRLAEGVPEVARDVLEREQLEPDLTGVARARDDHGPTLVRGLDAAHERRSAASGKSCAITSTDLGPLHRKEAPVLVVHEVHETVGGRLLEDLQHALGVRGVRHDEVPLLAEAVDDQILDHAAALVQDEVVERVADLRPLEVVRHHALQQVEGAGSRDLDLAQVREVEQARRVRGPSRAPSGPRRTRSASASPRTGRASRRGRGARLRAACASARRLRPSELEVARGPRLVEAPDGGGDGRLVEELGSSCASRGRLRSAVGERVERLLRLGLGRLDHERLLDDEREVDGRRVEAEIDQRAWRRPSRGPRSPPSAAAPSRRTRASDGRRGTRAGSAS